jgi:L-fuculose-phosphate aldolase
MATPVTFDPAIVDGFLRYARMVVARGYIHNTLGNMVIRAPHPDYPEHGVAYTKHAGVSLEEMQAENIVMTDVPSPGILAGNGVTSVGHNLSREILRLRPDIACAHDLVWGRG